MDSYKTKLLATLVKSHDTQLKHIAASPPYIDFAYSLKRQWLSAPACVGRTAELSIGLSPTYAWSVHIYLTIHLGQNEKIGRDFHLLVDEFISSSLFTNDAHTDDINEVWNHANGILFTLRFVYSSRCHLEIESTETFTSNKYRVVCD